MPVPLLLMPVALAGRLVADFLLAHGASPSPEPTTTSEHPPDHLSICHRPSLPTGVAPQREPSRWVASRSTAPAPRQWGEPATPVQGELDDRYDMYIQAVSRHSTVLEKAEGAKSTGRAGAPPIAVGPPL